MATYICSRWPEYQVGRAKFRSGIYRTDDAAMQHLIEVCDAFGVQIFKVAEDTAVPTDVATPRLRQGMRGSNQLV